MPRRDYGSSRAVPKLRSLIGQRIYDLRHQLDLTQVAVGQRAGLSGKFIGEIERGDKSVSVDSLYRVAAVLRVPMAALVTEGGPKPRKTGPRGRPGKISA